MLMARCGLLALVVLIELAPAQASAQFNIPNPISMQAAPPVTSLSYGPDRRQLVDHWATKGSSGKAPLILYIHGGGWKAGDKDAAIGLKPRYFSELGFDFSALNYRLVPDVTVEQQAEDVAAALRRVLDMNKERYRDQKIFLIGHSAGAHLAALIGTDERYLNKMGVALSQISGIICLDTAAFDVPKQFSVAGPRLRKIYEEAFSSDAVRQTNLSPISHVSQPNAAAFLLVHTARTDAAQQSVMFGSALLQAGTNVQLRAIDGQGLQGHAVVNTELGQEGTQITQTVENWLKAQLQR